jgi:RNA polymerase sigma-70 factor, ECF subfamily
MQAMAASAGVLYSPFIAASPRLHNRAVRPSAPQAAPLQGVADDQLVLLMRAREVSAERAMDELYARYSASVYGLARRMLRDERTAEEVLHDTFWRIWRHADSYQPGRVRFATWILRIAHNLAVSELRRDSRRPHLADPLAGGEAGTAESLSALLELPDSAPEVPDQVLRAERDRAIQAGLAALPKEQRQAVELAYLGGLTHVQIASRQGAPVSTVKTRLALGLRKLAGHLRQQRIGIEGVDGI